MKTLSLIITLFLFTVLSSAETIDRADLEPPIGSVFHFTGTFNGSYGDSVVTYLDGSGTVPGSVRTDNILSSSNPEGNVSVSSYTIDGALIRRDFSNAYGSFTQWYNPAWRLGPRLIEIGRIYQSSTSSSYQVNGISVSVSMSAAGKAIGTEWVTLPAGTFHALKLVFDVTITETWSGGWQEIIETDTIWAVRGVGVVKYIASANVRDSNGTNRNLTTNYSLSYTNRQLPVLTVTQSESWYSGLAYISYPWVYLYDSRRWAFVYGNPREIEMEGYTTAQFGDGYLNGYAYLGMPWLYSFRDGRFHYVYGPVWIYDMRAQSLWSW